MSLKILIRRRSFTSYRCDMNGNVVATNATITGNIDCRTLKIGGQDALTTSNKISTQIIEDLVVGGNVRMGENATISWGNVTNQPYIPRTAIDVGALASSSPMLTNITSNGIYTGTINANQINAGKINAALIDTTNLAAQKIYQQGYSNNYAIVGGSYGDLKLYYAGVNYFTVYNNIDSVSLQHNGKDYLVFSSVTGYSHPKGTWDFSTTNVIGLVAKFA